MNYRTRLNYSSGRSIHLVVFWFLGAQEFLLRRDRFALFRRKASFNEIRGAITANCSAACALSFLCHNACEG
jgi:hypothetical protein